MKNTTDNEAVLIKCERRECELGTLEYKIHMTPGRMIANYNLELYSISITLTDENGKESFSEVREIFASYRSAERFLRMLSENLATPIELIYIVEDELSRGSEY